MKKIISLVLLVFFVSFSSCRDTKAKEMENEATIEKIEAVDSESDKVLEEIKNEKKELESELNELDNL